MRILVTGFTGFIGSHFCRYVLGREQDVQVVGFSRNSDQANRRRLSMCDFHGNRLRSVWGDLTDHGAVSGLCEGIDVVVHFAAKTFVDASIKDGFPFIMSNVVGTFNLLEDAKRYGVKKYVQISTDEVYGQCLEGAYDERATINPRNVYAATKAAGDALAISYFHTFGLPVIITRTENNFGSFQNRQKAIPTFVRAAMIGEPLPVYGDGGHVRCWLHVLQHCAAIWHLVTAGSIGEIYHVAGEQELTNLDLAVRILLHLGKPADQIKFIPDRNIRPGHDRRYALDCAKLRATGFEVRQDLDARLRETVEWYRDNLDWLL